MKIRFALVVLLLLYVTNISGQQDGNYMIDIPGKGFRRIQAIKGTASTAYLVEGRREAMLVDACSGQEGLTEIIKELKIRKPLKVVLTHGHSDHSGGIKYFTDVYMHAADTSLLQKGSVKLHFIKEGDVIDLGGVKFNVLSIPGHTPGSLALYNIRDRYIFTGDGIGSTSVWAHISDDPLTVYLSSVKRLEALKDKIDELYVGHHEQEAVKLTTQYLTDMRIVTEKILSGEIESKEYGYGRWPGRISTWGSASVVFNPDNLK